jgi:HAMP domain-containing protein
MKLSLQFIGIILATALVSSLLVSFFSISFARTALETSISNSQEDLAIETLDKIDRLMLQKVQEVQLLAENPLTEAFILNPGLVSIETEREILREYELLTGPWDVIHLADKNGNLVVTTQKAAPMTLAETGRHSLAAFHAALNGNNYYSDVEISSATGRPTVFFASPIREEETAGRSVVGVVIGQLSMPVVYEILDEIDTPGRHIDLFNSKGIVIATATANRNEILQENLARFSLVSRALAGQCGSFTGPGRDGTHSVSSCALQDGHLEYKGSGWGLLIETPQSVVYAPVTRLTQTLLFITAFSILSALMLALYLTSTISKQVDTLKGAADKIAKGYLDEHIPMGASDELASLAESLDTMRFSLKRVIAEYETQNRAMSALNKKKETQMAYIKKKQKSMADYAILAASREAEVTKLKQELKKLKAAKVKERGNNGGT